MRHGSSVLFGSVLADQIGLPVPALPVLLAMGALAGRGGFSLPLGLLLAVLACLLSDIIWYELGRRRGHTILNLLCRISLEPDSCVRRTQEAFARRGARSLLIAKFVPGLSTAAPPLAGMLHMRRSVFTAWDSAGAVAWSGAFAGLGYIFSNQLERVAGLALRLGSLLFVLLAAGLAAYIAWKYFERRRFIRSLRIARITPEELHEKMRSGEDVTIIDLRHSTEFEADELKLPGALRLRPQELEVRNDEIPRDRDVILYCT